MCNIGQMYYEDGMEKGMEMQLIYSVSVMLSDKKSYEEIAKTLHMPLSEVERIAKLAEVKNCAFA